MLILTSVFASEDNKKEISKSNSYEVIQTSKSYNNNEIINSQVKPIQTSYLNKHEDKKYNPSRRRHYYGQTLTNNFYYTHYSTEETRKNLFGDYVKEYSVSVINKGKTGKYFTVKFDLTDKKGYEFAQSVTQYLRTGEKKNFIYKDIQYEKNEILHWDYSITSENY